MAFDSVFSSKTKIKLCNLGGAKSGELIFDHIKSRWFNEDRFTREEVLKKYNGIYKKLESTEDKKTRRKLSNSAWYDIYVKYQENTKILVMNRDYLLCRDMNVACIWILFFYIASTFIGLANLEKKLC